MHTPSRNLAAKQERPPAGGLSSKLFHWSVYHFVLIAAIAISVPYMFNGTNSVLLAVSAALLPVLTVAWLIVALSFFVKIGVRRNDRESVIWFSFLGTAILWLIELVVFELELLVFGVPASAISLDDVFDLAGYATLMFGLIMQLWPFREQLLRRSMMALLTCIAISDAFILYSVLPIFLNASGITWQSAIVNSTYLVLDVVCISIAIPTLLMLLKGTFWRPFLFVVMGMIFLLVADIASGLAVVNGTFFPGHPSDLIYDFGVLSAMLGWYLKRKQYVTKSL